MSASGSRWSLSSATTWKSRAKVSPALAIPPDSQLLEVSNHHYIRVIYKPRITSITPNQGDKEELVNEKIILFFIHGVGESADAWRLQITYFHDKGYDIVAPDLLGHGLSSKPAETRFYEFENLAQDMLYVFDSFKGKRNVIIGHSYGTSFCTLIAKERSSHVSKMVLISGGGPTPLKPDACSPFCFPLPVFVAIQPLIVRAYRRKAFYQPTMQKFDDKKIFSVSSSVLRAVMQGQQWPEATEEYHSDLLVPVLLLQGKNDNFMSFDDAQWMHETIYGSDLHVIDEAGHMVMIEQPDQVNELILHFLSRDPSTKPKISATEVFPASQKSSLIPIDINSQGYASSEKELNVAQSHAVSIASMRASSRISNADVQHSPAIKLRKSKVLL